MARAMLTRCRCPPAAVTDIGVVAVFRSFDEFVGIGYAGSLFHLLLRGVVNTEGDVVEEGVVEEYRLLVHVADKLSEVVDVEVFHVDAVDEHLTLLHVVVSRNEVYHG